MKRPVDVVAAIFLVLLMIGFLGFTRAIIPRFGSDPPEVRSETSPALPNIGLRR